MGRPRKRQPNGLSKNVVNVDHYPPGFEQASYNNNDTLVDPYFNHGNLSISDVESNHPDLLEKAGMENGVWPLTETTWDHGNEVLDVPISSSSEDTLSGILDPALQALLPESHVTMEHQHLHQPGKAPCGCLASIYLAMASLQELPTEIASALATVRVAANAIQAVIRCEHCGICLVRDLHPPIEVFQNTMMLGAALPTIAHGYKRLLQMVDCETKLASAMAAKKTFRLKDYGSDFGIEELARDFRDVENIPLDPEDWRSAVRRLIIFDVYGHENISTGLKGIIAEMEHRQRNRHTEVDRLKAAGLLNEIETRMCVNEKDALCLRILDTAKIALDNLVVE
jgi:hypothetical protein